MACVSKSIISLIIGFGFFVAIFALIILAIIALIKYIKNNRWTKNYIYDNGNVLILL